MRCAPPGRCASAISASDGVHVPGRIVIVGAGQAGGWVARTLRDEGFAGEVVLIGDEPHPPHERPPLSKDVLLGRAPATSTHLFRGDALRQLELDFRPGCRVVALRRHDKILELADGAQVAFDRLVLATGGRPARLPVLGGEHALLLRSIADAAALRARMLGASRMIVIGGGWIGLEVAAAARAMGLEVAILEAAGRLCSRAAHPLLSDYLLDLHRRHDVELRLSAHVAALDETGAQLAGGERLSADLLVAGIGMVPNDELARAAGLAVDGGVLADSCGRTEDPSVFACGDVAVYDHPVLHRRVRLESWANAQNQAIACARAVLGRPAANVEAPWFWSDQYGTNIQMVGALPRDAEIVVRGEPSAGKGSWFAAVGDRLVGAVAINAGRDIRAAKRLIETGAAIDRTSIADPSISLR
jgi:3-phenylpropionate/trans-cinnamate dioxygenase ferredoxin reductase subunit